VIAGFAAMLIGAVDPLEGSVVILLGSGMVTLEATLGKSRYRTLLFWSLALVAVGVGALWALSAVGGFGGRTGRSYWWSLVLLPYPIGWIMGLAGAILRLREASRVAVSSGAAKT
jgi:hypothetical protein